MKFCARTIPVNIIYIYIDEFALYLHYCKALKFEDKPDYSYLKKMFKGLFYREDFHHEMVFDWTLVNVNNIYIYIYNIYVKQEYKRKKRASMMKPLFEDEEKEKEKEGVKTEEEKSGKDIDIPEEGAPTMEVRESTYIQRNQVAGKIPKTPRDESNTLMKINKENLKNKTTLVTPHNPYDT